MDPTVEEKENDQNITKNLTFSHMLLLLGDAFVFYFIQHDNI